MTEKTYCDDWGCPARVSCAHHFGRSEAYAAMRVPSPKVEHGPETMYFRGPRDHCEQYELDKPKPWLAAVV